MSTSSQTPTLAAIREQKGIILGVKHWRSIPEYVAEMGALNQQLRQLKGTAETDHAPTPRQQAPAPHRIETGDRVRHAEYGIGEVLGMQYSAKLHHLLVYVHYQDGEKRWSMEGDLEYVEEG